ncbi:MAG: recombination protein RmuC [Gaiellaceae bacterium]|jgi:DNA recombination protein RmuC|nr:recombination protein RmuC [Gaiellaceae bacterium]
MAIGLLLIGLVLGAAVAWIVGRAHMGTDVARLESALEHERSVGAEKVAVLVEAREELSTQLRSMCAEALRGNNEQFIELAKAQFAQLQLGAKHDLDSRQKAVENLVGPIKESLERVGGEVKTLEKSRRQDVGLLTAQLKTVADTNERLRAETGSLVTALRAPSVHGRWGEMQLKNTVESAGMLAYCDFVTQLTGQGEEDRILRPDLVVRLPGGRTVVVDAKTPIQALLDAAQTNDEAVRAQRLADFVRNVRDHMAALKAKSYWKQFESAPDFVVMFLPGESFFRAALEQDPSLLEQHASSGIVLASPATLITMLRTIAVSWREEQIAESARAVSDLGRELYERLATMAEHFVTLGKRLDGSVQAYNQTVGSFERRVLVSARKFPEHGLSTNKEIPEVVPVDKATQPPQTIELPARDLDALPSAADANAA